MPRKSKQPCEPSMILHLGCTSARQVLSATTSGGLWFPLWVIVLALMLAGTAKAQAGGGHLVFGDFKVSESKDGKPTPQVFNVILYSVFGSVVARQTVTNHGRYQCYNVNNGEYDIVVEVEAHEVARLHFVLTSSLRSDFRYDISLEWREAGSKRKADTISAEDFYN